MTDLLPEFEHLLKTCKQCGTKSRLLVLVCPVCSELLADEDRPEVPDTTQSPDIAIQDSSCAVDSVQSEAQPPTEGEFEAEPESIRVVALNVVKTLVIMAVVIGFAILYQNH